MSTLSLLSQIDTAFPAAVPPSREDVLYEGAYRGDPELEEIREFFGGRRWNSITPSDVFRFRHALSFFSPSALAYFTAAWMTSALQDEEVVDTAIEDLVGALEKADADLWTREQRNAICDWIEHFSCSDLPTLKHRLESALWNMGRV